jgi:NDP-sugar pyrophosphorylase family protein
MCGVALASQRNVRYASHNMHALVIAGGEGQRLRPLTDDRPKGMVPVAGKPILQHQLEWLRSNGLRHAVIACGYRYDVIEEYFEDGSRFGISVGYSIEQTPLGRGGALKQAFAQVPREVPYVIATNGDNIQTQPLAPMLRQHLRTGAVATLLLTQLRSPYGIAQQRGKHITGFVEKPLLSHWLNAGVYVLNREFLEACPDVGDHEDHLFPTLAAEGKLYGFRSRAYWKAIDTVKDLKEAETELSLLAGK